MPSSWCCCRLQLMASGTSSNDVPELQFVRCPDGPEREGRLMANTYLYVPGTSGNYASAPNATPLQLSTLADIRVNVALNWSSNSTMELCSRWSAAPNLSYVFYL